MIQAEVDDAQDEAEEQRERAVRAERALASLEQRIRMSTGAAAAAAAAAAASPGDIFCMSPGFAGERGAIQGEGNGQGKGQVWLRDFFIYFFLCVWVRFCFDKCNVLLYG